MLKVLLGTAKAAKRVPPKLKPPVPPPTSGDPNSYSVDEVKADFKEALVWILDAEEVLKTHKKTIPEGEMLLKRLHGGKWWSDLLKRY